MTWQYAETADGHYAQKRGSNVTIGPFVSRSAAAAAVRTINNEHTWLIDTVAKTTTNHVLEQEEAFRAHLKKNYEKISESAIFLDLYHESMLDFLREPWPVIQLAVAILLDKPLLLLVGEGREPSAKLLALAEEVIYYTNIDDLQQRLEPAIKDFIEAHGLPGAGESV